MRRSEEKCGASAGSQSGPGGQSYRVCVRCVMDTTDPEIQFDEQGVCNHCKQFDRTSRIFPRTAEEKARKLGEIVAEIKQAGLGRKYDCVIGLSGGVDSTYVAYKVKELGLRPLAVHFDNGWNSELSVKNIENIVKKLDIDLYTYVMDWEEFRNLQLSFLKASTPDCEAPTDHAIQAILVQTAIKNGIRHVVAGNNHATEGVLPTSYSYGGHDWKYIRSIHKRFGSVRLRHFPHYSLLDRMKYVFVHKVRNYGLLNYLDYNKAEAMRTIQEKLDWKNYGGKHYESIYTRFYQGVILAKKFGMDKRKAHLSSLILSGQLTREHAFEELGKPACSSKMEDEDREYVIKKFELTESEWEQIWNTPPKKYSDYPTYDPLLKRVGFLVRFAKKNGLLPKRVGF